MRRILGTAVIATAAVLAAFTPAQAQLSAGVMAGANSSKFSISDLASDEGTSSYTGWMAGGWVGAHVGSIIAVQLEAFYTRKGSKLETSGAPTATFKVDYVELAGIVRVGIPIIPAIKPYLFGGPAIAFNTSCKIGFDNTSDENCDAPLVDIEVKSTDVSGIIGLGIQISRFLIAIQYDHGFDNILVDDTSDTTVNNRTWTVKGGFGM